MLNAVLFIVAFLGMEIVAWFTHKYIMHGFLWVLHKDHHAPHNKKFERNDWFAFMFAVPSLILIFLGKDGFDYRFWIGAGIAFYGINYFLFHDVLYHQRLKILPQDGNKYFKAVIKAHGDHHAGKKNYGFLFMFPWKYIRNEFKPKMHIKK